MVVVEAAPVVEDLEPDSDEDAAKRKKKGLESISSRQRICSIYLQPAEEEGVALPEVLEVAEALSELLEAESVVAVADEDESEAEVTAEELVTPAVEADAAVVVVGAAVLELSMTN